MNTLLAMLMILGLVFTVVTTALGAFVEEFEWRRTQRLMAASDFVHPSMR
ncbi:hypothetical protein BH09ACT10_BH09ACT10_23730 [soil metagenome]